MRDIKFRGKINGQWKYVTPGDSYVWAKFWAVVDRETVGQYAGESDERETKIYEGDILGLEDPEDKSRCVVEFTGAAFRLKIVGKDYYHIDWSNWIVIGNTCDNPELLKESQ